MPKKLQPAATIETNCQSGAEVRFLAGDWSQIHQLLPCVKYDEKDLNCHPGDGPTSGYDIILMAETIYSVSAHQSLYGLIKKVFDHKILVSYCFLSLFFANINY